MPLSNPLFKKKPEVRPSKQQVFIVYGKPETEYEGTIFAICSTEEKANQAIAMLDLAEDLAVSSIVTDSLLINEQMVFI